MQENLSARGRLDSWKEIAAYLHRDIRTVIRWGKERGLPVHRVPGGKRQAVFAYPDEINAWLGSLDGNGSSHPDAVAAGGPVFNGHAMDHHAVTSGADIGSREFARMEPSFGADIGNKGVAREKQSDSRSLLRSYKLLVALFCLLGLAGLGAMLARPPLTIRPLSLRKLTDDGHSKGYPLTDGATLYFTQAEGARAILASAPMSGSPVRIIETPFSNVSLQDISSDGKSLLVISFEGILIEGPLWTIPTQGGTPHRVGDAVCTFARWSPGNRRIACTRRTTITVMGADGSNPHTIASFAMPVSQITWTPEGNHLRYILNDTTAHTSSQWEVEVTSSGTTKAQQLSLGPGCCLDWTWTGDGKAFVYIALDARGKSHLMMQPGRAGPATEIPVNVGTLGSVAPGKAGNSLFLSIAGASRNELLKFDAQRETFETVLPGLSAAYLSFSRDGQWMTYTDAGGGPLWRSRADGSQTLQLAGAAMDVEVSSWSPDGRRVAFMGRKPGQPYRIYLTDRDGGDLEEASEGNDNQGGPSWSPDGKFIVYGNVFCEKTQNCWIRRLDLATRKTQILPGSNGLRTARWSPDGTSIAALRFQTRELMLFDISAQRWRLLAESVAGDNINWSSDSQYVFVDSPRDMKPVVERIRVRDGHRTTVVSLALLQNVPGTLDTWFGLAPNNSPILSHVFTGSEIYELKWTDK